MTVDRRKSLRTKRHELGFQLTIDWCVWLTICFLLLSIQCLALEDVIQKIRKRSDEPLYIAYEINSDVSLTPQSLPDNGYSGKTHETSTMYEKLGTPEKLVSDNGMDAWKIISFAIENAQKFTTSKVILDTDGGIESSTKQFTVNETRNSELGEKIDYNAEVTTFKEEQTTLKSIMDQELYLKSDNITAESESEITTVAEEFSIFNFNTEQTIFNIDEILDNTTDIEATTYNEIPSTVKTDLDLSASFAYGIVSNYNESDAIADLQNSSQLIDTNNMEMLNHTQDLEPNENIHYPSHINSFELVTKPNKIGVLERNGYNTQEVINKSNEGIKPLTLDKDLKNFTESYKVIEKEKNVSSNTEENNNKNYTFENISARKENNSKISIRSNKKLKSMNYNKNILNTATIEDDKNDSNENKIDDIYELITEPTKVFNSSIVKHEKPQNCSNCTFQRRLTNVTDEIESAKVSNKTRSVTKARNSTRVESKRIESTSPKPTTEEDYNISYEIEDSEEDSKTIKSTINPTEEPLSFGPLNNLRDFASGLIESFYERVIPKGLRDIVTRLQEQNEKLETYNLRSKEENGGLGQFGRSIIKGISGPINQVMQGVRDFGSLDSDRNFLAGVASGVVSFADGVTDSFRDRVKAIYPGTLWCGDGHMARSAEVGLFFMTDSCCQKHDSCKYFIPAGETKFGLTNTGIFTRSHCECDKAFYRCLKKTNSLVSSQIGLTYFSILGPQCFRRDFPIIKCSRRTRVTGQKCEEYLLDYSQPKIWQWFDNETF